MYSGITRGLFTVVQVEKKPGLTNYVVRFSDELCRDLQIGASVSIDGVCQTVVSIQENEIAFQAMQNTLNITTLNDLYVGRKVSVERSLRFGEEMGGHEIAGHVSGTVTVIDKQLSENNLTLIVSCPKNLLKYILHKGFIAVDGSSLTVGKKDTDAGTFTLHLIPETLRVTNFGNKNIGDKMNIEIDAKTQAIVDTVEKIMAENFNAQINM